MGTTIYKTKKQALSDTHKYNKKFGLKKSQGINRIKFRKRTRDYVIRW